MLSDSFLKLAVGVAIGGAIFYKYKKSHVKQDTLHKPTIGKKIDPEHVLNKKSKKMDQRMNARLKKTSEMKIKH